MGGNVKEMNRRKGNGKINRKRVKDEQNEQKRQIGCSRSKYRVLGIMVEEKNKNLFVWVGGKGGIEPRHFNMAAVAGRGADNSLYMQVPVPDLPGEQPDGLGGAGAGHGQCHCGEV
jgi:hypothetical protein